MYVYSLHYEHAHCRSDILINIEMPAWQIKVGGQFSRLSPPILPLKLVAMAKSLEPSQNKCTIYQAVHSSTNPKNFVKIGPVVSHLIDRPLQKKYENKKNK